MRRCPSTIDDIEGDITILTAGDLQDGVRYRLTQRYLLTPGNKHDLLLQGRGPDRATQTEFKQTVFSFRPATGPLQ